MVEFLDLNKGVQGPSHHNERLVGKLGNKVGNKVHREVKRKLEKEGYFVEDMGFCRGGYKKFRIDGQILLKVSNTPSIGIDQLNKCLLTAIKIKKNQN